MGIEPHSNVDNIKPNKIWTPEWHISTVLSTIFADIFNRLGLQIR